ncbi:MAG: 1,4-alpha-glucan branching protein GlgB [Clostridia bacterium]|nr:1,4-alpha-glucan branching protein GlgB [Clostridia bacterium]
MIHENSGISEELMFLFNTGRNSQVYNILGAHKGCVGGVSGYGFAVWAPNAKSVSVVCDSNGWNREKNPMTLYPNHGIWYCFIDGIDVGEKYKFSIEDRNGEVFLKSDPFAFESQVRPETASVVADTQFEWSDKSWLRKRAVQKPYDKPMSIYEVHFGSWKRHENGEMLTYSQMAEELIPYVRDMGYTHIELMPICEYPFDGSWGYQVTGYYSANSRYGKPWELKKFIDECHKAEIGVIMDWVPAHFPRDAHGLRMFDGTPLFEHPDSRLGEHKEWGTLVFNWEKSEINSFLISNAVFWLEEYHMDGLRVDAVSSMLYLDYNRRDGEWVANKYGGHENLAAIEFLQNLNRTVFERFPNVLMIAEESTAWGGVTMPVHEGGLGFNFKWNMGWMNDILRFMAMDPFFRGSNHDMLTFSMMYAYSENYILALSHDEVVHGKKSLIDKMWGNYEQKFKGLKLLLAYMYAHPGKKLLCMGGEFGQFIEWRFAEGLEWQLLGFDTHRGMSEFSKDLNWFYRNNRSMNENDEDWSGFKWIDASDREHSVISFVRISRSGRDKTVVVANFAAQEHKGYRLCVPSRGEYEIVLSTDDKKYGGLTEKPCIMKAKKVKNKEFDYAIDIDIPELSALYIKRANTRKMRSSDSLTK